MQRDILSDIHYAYTFEDRDQDAGSTARTEDLSVFNLSPVFKEAAAKHGFRFSVYTNWSSAKIDMFKVDRDVPFDEMKHLLAEVGQKMNCNLYVSLASDCKSLPWDQASDAVKKNALLKFKAP